MTAPKRDKPKRRVWDVDREADRLLGIMQQRDDHEARLLIADDIIKLREALEAAERRAASLSVALENSLVNEQEATHDYHQRGHKLEAAEREISYLKEKLNATFERAEDAEREVFARDAALEIKDAEIGRLTRELEAEKLRSDQFGDTTAKLLDERDALREAVEALKQHIEWENRTFGLDPCDLSASWRKVLDALAALDAGKEKR